MSAPRSFHDEAVEGGDTFSGLEGRIHAALQVVADWAYVDGGHHKQWVIDQTVRALTGPDYDDWVGDDEWDTGVAP